MTVSARFEAAHNLIDYKDGPAPLHGHSYLVEAVLETEKLQRYGDAGAQIASAAAYERLLAIPARDQTGTPILREATLLAGP